MDFSNFDDFPNEVEEEIPEEVHISLDEGYSSGIQSTEVEKKHAGDHSVESSTSQLPDSLSSNANS